MNQLLQYVCMYIQLILYHKKFSKVPYSISIKFSNKLNLAKLANHYQIAKFKFCQHYFCTCDTQQHSKPCWLIHKTSLVRNLFQSHIKREVRPSFKHSILCQKDIKAAQKMIANTAVEKSKIVDCAIHSGESRISEGGC